MEQPKTLEARLEETKIMLEDLLSCPDELPEEFILGDQRYARHKFRGNWFQGVNSCLQLAAKLCEDEELMRQTREFMNRRRMKGTNARTTREEINEADALIRKALALLKS